jgi:hypothetical protein
VTTALLDALTAHASLRVLILSSNPVNAAHQADMGAALGALVAANAPALHTLNVSCGSLGDVGLRPLCDALPQNTHLRELAIFSNSITEVLARDVLLPAVRANTSLRKLDARLPFHGEAHAANVFLQQAEELVAARADAEEAAAVQ